MKVTAPKAVVTGATGFMGQHLCHQLCASGWKVQAAHRPSSTDATLTTLREIGVETVPIVTPPDIRELVADTQPDVVFHLAAHQAMRYSAGDVNPFLEANIALGVHLLEGLAGSHCVVVNAASYFQFRDGDPVSHSLYAATKQAFVDISLFYRDKRGVDVRHVVLYDSFGPADTRNKLIPQLIEAANSNTPISLGPANQVVDALYVDDVVAGLIAASGEGNPGWMSVKATHNTTVGEIVNEIERISNTSIEKSFDSSRAPNDIVERSGSWPLPANWQPRWTLREALKATYLGPAV